MSLLAVRRLSKRFPIRAGVWRRPAGFVQALAEVSFEIGAGETLAVVGGSGSGKTTLARILCRVLEADQGEVLWEARPSASFSRTAWARNIQMVFQDPYASLNPKLSVGTQLAEMLQMSAAPAQPPEDLLSTVQLPREAVDRYPFQFSGGQRQRIAIARALALGPRLLILDEPLSALDMATQAQIVSLFQAVREKSGLSYLLITHDLDLAAQLADRAIVLQAGRIVEEGEVRHVLSAPQHPYTQALIDALPR